MLDLPGLQMRATLLRLIRSFFYERHFLEVDTPLRQPVLIPESTIVPLTAEGQYLQTSPELCMKRLLARGCSKLFQICPCFRKEEVGRLHLEEFTMLEWYRTGADYLTLMSDCEALLRFIVENMQSVDLPDPGNYPKKLLPEIDIESEWQRLSVAEAFGLFSPVPMAEALAKGSFDELLVEFIEPHLGVGVPTFLYDYPASQCALAKIAENEQQVVVAKRFELFFGELELANGFHELTDSDEQLQRFKLENKVRKQRGKESASIDENFIHALSSGLPECAGVAVGIDRLLMALVNATQIAQVMAFSWEKA